MQEKAGSLALDSNVASALIDNATIMNKQGANKYKKETKECWKGLYTKILMFVLCLLLISTIVVVSCGFRFERC